MRKVYVLAVLSLVFNNIEAQNFNWANKGGLWAYDYGEGITTDVSGNVYCAGKYEQNAIFSGVTLPNGGNGNHDVFLAKYDPSGGLTWISTAGGPSGDYAHAIACNGVSSVCVAGEIEGNPGDIIVFPGSSITLTTMGTNDILLAKYDLNGTLLWARSAGDWDNEKALGVAYDNSGNIFICGLFNSTATFGGSTTITGNGLNDIFLAKYDMNGNFMWVRSAGSTGRDEAKSIKCDAAGNVYICGMYSNGAVFGSQTLTSLGYFDAFLAKYDNNGTLLWVKRDGGNYDDVAWSLTLDNAGKIYVTGEFNASAFFGATQLITTGMANVYVACYDANANVLWATGAGGSLNDRARGIGCDGTNIFITGQFGSTASFGSHTVTAADSSDIFFASISNTGNFLGAASVGGVADSVETLGFESGIAICAEASGNVYAVGSTLDGGVFGSTTLTPYTRTDVFVTKITQLVDVNTFAANSESILVYPNPAKGDFILDLDQLANQKIELCIFNCYGQILDKRTETSSSKINIDLSAQESGIYFVEVKLENKETIRKKMVVQK